MSKLMAWLLPWKQEQEACIVYLYRPEGVQANFKFERFWWDVDI